MDFWFVSLLALTVFCPELSFPVGLSRWIQFLGARLCLCRLSVSCRPALHEQLAHRVRHPGCSAGHALVHSATQDVAVT